MRAILILLALAVAAGCQTTPADQQAGAGVEDRKPGAKPGAQPVERPQIGQTDLTKPGARDMSSMLKDPANILSKRTVYFDYDKSDLTDDTRNTIRGNADWLKQNAKWKVVIEGHTDERGTIEYNLALGQRRADAVRDYMTSLGLAATRLRTVSYGEERPAQAGTGETAWGKNRRAEFKVE